MNIRALRTYARLSLVSILAIVAAYVAQVQFIRQGDFAPGLVIIAAVAVVMILLARRETGAPSVDEPLAHEKALLVLILVFAAAMRLWNLAGIPEGVWYDEAQNGLVANQILTDASYRPVYIGDLTQLPALFFYYIAAFIAIVGPNILAVRLASASLGILTIPLIYLLGKELYGPRIGLIAAALLALDRTHTDFSRFGMNGITAPFFLVLTLYFVVRALRTRQSRFFIGAGVSLGLGLYSYLAFNVVPVLLAVWLLQYIVVEKLWRRPEILRPAAYGVVALLIVVAPLVGFAIQNPDVFSQRASTVSIFKDKNLAESKDAFLANLWKHAEMFNFRGDNNGRHNLPGEPMLDNLSAAFFLVGIAVALSRSKNPVYSLLPLGLVITLLPGILSLDFEAPQFYRTIGVIPIVWLLVAVGVAQPLLALGRWLGQSDKMLTQVCLVVIVGWIGYSSASTYWNRQINDFAVWTAFSIPETIIGREVARIGPKTGSYVDDLFNGTPTQRFLAPGLNPITFGLNQLPFQNSTDVVVFLSDRNQTWTTVLKRIYPRLTVKPFRLPDGSPIVLYEVNIPKSEVDASRGLTARYFEGTKPSDRPAFVRSDPSIDFDWTKQQPVKMPFTASWNGVIAAARSGPYQFKVEGVEPSQFLVDGTNVTGQTLNLAQGGHVVELTVTIDTASRIRLLWLTPDKPGVWEVIPTTRLLVRSEAGRGLQGSYFSNPTWTGKPSLFRIDPEISTHYHNVPLGQPFSVQWDGKIDIPTGGIYRFGTQSIDASWLAIDGKTLVSNDQAKDQYIEGAVNLDPGLHDIQVKFIDSSGFSFIDVYWTPPGQGRSHVPGERLFPPRAAYTERAGALAPTTEVTDQTPPATAATAPAAQSNPVAVTPPTLPHAKWVVKQTIVAPPGASWSLGDPRGVAIDTQGNIYVADAKNGDVVKLKSDGTFGSIIGSKGEGPGQFVEPTSLLIDPQGKLVVLDSGSGRIQVFNLDGGFQKMVGATAGVFYHPRGLAMDSQGQYYVADTGTGRIAVLSPDGAVVKELKHQPDDNEVFKQPVGVAVASNGSLIVTDAETARLNWYDASFQLIKSTTIAPFDSVRCAQIVVLNDNTWYQSDPNGHRLVHFDATGTPTEQIGSSAELGGPMGMALDAAGMIYVADAANRQIVVFGPQ